MEIQDIFLYLPRLFPLFKSPVTKRQINYVEISNRGTGKTTTFMILQEVFNFRYYTETPTYANLVYDARNNMYGAVFLSNGLIFDEIQNWKDGYSVKELGAINATLVHWSGKLCLDQRGWNRKQILNNSKMYTDYLRWKSLLHDSK